MSEPATNGRVRLETSLGPLEVELWSREAPKACRNFVGLCLEGYYDGTLFHRVTKDFVMQGGDRECGDGTGGTSIFASAQDFPTEANQRLRFASRGLLATAPGPRGNTSQFFVTLALNAPLERSKHSIFGRVVGESLYNLLRANECVVDQDDRPLFPPVLIRAEVLDNPFGDLGPRAGVTWQRKEEQEGTRGGEKKKRRPRRKNTNMLSFGEEGEEELLGAEEGGHLLTMRTEGGEGGEGGGKRAKLEEQQEEKQQEEKQGEEEQERDEKKEKKEKKKDKKKEKKEKKKEKKKEEKEKKPSSVKPLVLKRVAPPPEEDTAERQKELARYNDKKLKQRAAQMSKQQQDEVAVKLASFRKHMHQARP